MSTTDLPPPFVNIEGVINLRVVGGFATSDPSARVKPVAFYRAGDISRITEPGKQALIALGITRVFDFRSAREIASYQTPPATIPGVEVVRCPVSETEGFDPVSLAVRLQKFDEDEAESFRIMYREILDSAAPVYARIIRDMIAHPDDPCLVHCTAGKDRTGLFSAIVEMILGVSDEDIINDYTLTTVGMAPIFPLLAKKFQDQPVYRDNWEGLLKMGSSKPETMHATLAMIREEYGGAEGYLHRAGVTDAEIKALREAFLVKQ
ncbi:protein-tyrosine phosphatase-like protein [Schizophyllum amplum]|uniref:Protein-tyrosine phosphatase-like protein n=1 Tax=Schizophyllum amplum TaxID=97359 RepID=A0A550CVM3_9AGAR|nr:protein-tyrosine phosphatase-like protein [Auriculariopsis ampla]